jgi:hypothetical protein
LGGPDLLLDGAAYSDGQEWYDPALDTDCAPKQRGDGRWFCTPQAMDVDAPPQGVTLVELESLGW